LKVYPIKVDLITITNLTCKRFWFMSIFARVVIVKKKTIVECLYVNNIVEGFHCLNPLPERKENLPFSMYHNFLAAPFYLKKRNGNDAFKNYVSLFSFTFDKLRKNVITCFTDPW